MRLVTKEGIERLLRANPIAELAAERGIELRPLGPELLVGRCPRHADRAGRSLLMEPKTGRFRCLACPVRGGNALGLVIQLDGVGLMVALETLAARAGVDLDEVMVATAATRRRRVRTGSVPVWALTPQPSSVIWHGAR